MSEFELSAILDATVRLTELRQNECKHLSIENASAEIFKSLIMAYGEYQECLERSKRMFNK